MKKNNSFSIIIPSYNESKSLNLLLRSIRKLYSKVPIYVIDDSTASENNKIKNITSKIKKVYLTSRRLKLGRGSAVMEGLNKAFKEKNITNFIEMDSDLAHDPKELKRFINKFASCDLIIGSRYLPGGKIVNIEKHRTILSRLINLFLRYWLGIKVSDFTTGYRAYSRSAVQLILRGDIESKGFITLSETLYKIYKGNLVIGEIPITWNFRKYGKSNVNVSELIKSLIFVVKLRIFK